MMNDKYLDEKIIKMMNQEEKQLETVKTHELDADVSKENPEKRSIYSGVKINGQVIVFELRSLIEEQLVMMVPKEFYEMMPEQAKAKYPSEQRPDTILTDYTGTINLLFDHMKDSMSNADAEMVRDNLIGMMHRVNPGVKPQAVGLEVISGKNVAYVEFSNTVMDGKLYNLMFFLELAGRILMGSFNCRSKDMKYWKETAFQMMRSIQIVTQQADGKEYRADGSEK